MENGEFKSKTEFTGTQPQLESGLVTLMIEYCKGVEESSSEVLDRLIYVFNVARVLEDLDNNKKVNKNSKGLN